MSAPKPLPFDTTVSEDLIWEAAGITKADRARALAHAFHRTREAMDASVVKVFQYQGEVVTSRPMIDHDTRLKAAKQAASFAGVSERNTTPAPVVGQRRHARLGLWSAHHGQRDAAGRGRAPS